MVLEQYIKNRIKEAMTRTSFDVADVTAKMQSKVSSAPVKDRSSLSFEETIKEIASHVDENTFVSFVDQWDKNQIPSAGTSPKLVYNTPHGFYGYPFQPDNFVRLMRTNKPTGSHFATNRPFMHVYRVITPSAVRVKKTEDDNLISDKYLGPQGVIKAKADIKEIFRQDYLLNFNKIKKKVDANIKLKEKATNDPYFFRSYIPLPNAAATVKSLQRCLCAIEQHYKFEMTISSDPSIKKEKEAVISEFYDLVASIYLKMSKETSSNKYADIIKAKRKGYMFWVVYFAAWVTAGANAHKAGARFSLYLHNIGIKSVLDYGTSTIHSSEPAQAFSINQGSEESYELLGTYNNYFKSTRRMTKATLDKRERMLADIIADPNNNINDFFFKKDKPKYVQKLNADNEENNYISASIPSTMQAIVDALTKNKKPTVDVLVLLEELQDEILIHKKNNPKFVWFSEHFESSLFNGIYFRKFTTDYKQNKKWKLNSFYLDDDGLPFDQILPSVYGSFIGYIMETTNLQTFNVCLNKVYNFTKECVPGFSSEISKEELFEIVELVKSDDLQKPKLVKENIKKIDFNFYLEALKNIEDKFSETDYKEENINSFDIMDSFKYDSGVFKTYIDFNTLKENFKNTYPFEALIHCEDYKSASEILQIIANHFLVIDSPAISEEDKTKLSKFCLWIITKFNSKAIANFAPLGGYYGKIDEETLKREMFLKSSTNEVLLDYVANSKEVLFEDLVSIMFKALFHTNHFKADYHHLDCIKKTHDNFFSTKFIFEDKFLIDFMNYVEKTSSIIGKKLEYVIKRDMSKGKDFNFYENRSEEGQFSVGVTNNFVTICRIVFKELINRGFTGEAIVVASKINDNFKVINQYVNFFFGNVFDIENIIAKKDQDCDSILNILATKPTSFDIVKTVCANPEIIVEFLNSPKYKNSFNKCLNLLKKMPGFEIEDKIILQNVVLMVKKQNKYKPNKALKDSIKSSGKIIEKIYSLDDSLIKDMFHTYTVTHCYTRCTNKSYIKKGKASVDEIVNLVNLELEYFEKENNITSQMKKYTSLSMAYMHPSVISYIKTETADKINFEKVKFAMNKIISDDAMRLNIGMMNYLRYNLMHLVKFFFNYDQQKEIFNMFLKNKNVKNSIKNYDIELIDPQHFEKYQHTWKQPGDTNLSAILNDLIFGMWMSDKKRLYKDFGKSSINVDSLLESHIKYSNLKNYIKLFLS